MELHQVTTAITTTIKATTMVLFTTVFFLLTQHAHAHYLSTGFDAFLLRPISANVTCGDPPEEYYNTKEGYVSPRLRQLSLCNASDPFLSRPASYMVDGNESTSWQSRNDVDKAFISIPLEQPMYGKQILFKFGDYRRPGQIAIYKSSNYGKTYKPWHFLVSHKKECTDIFGIPANEIFVHPHRKLNRVLCREYSGPSFEYGEQVLVELNGEVRGDGSNIYESDALLEWMNVTNVHIRFSGLYRKYDYIDTRWHHYVVNQISLIARCDCNGHGDGITCPMNGHGTRQCVCNDNTCGTHCEKCCPAFNQYPWKRGSRSSWISDNTTRCEACNCHGHSKVCRYNQEIADNKRSLNIHGQYSGGGQCLDCQHNTEGVNCEKCQRFHYEPEGVDRSSIEACPPCGCSPKGSLPGAHDSDIQYRECVRDHAMTKVFQGKKIGDCFCKNHVTGAKCDTCADGFYRLEASNNKGCRPCKCFLDGTVQRLNLCHKDFFGQCPCKKNTKLRDCSMCKDGYYELTDNNPDGCKWCGCDIGGSINVYVCNKINGDCTCRPHIYGKQCKKIKTGFFFPDMHFIFGGKNKFEPPKPTLDTILYIPKLARYKILIGYTLDLFQTAILTLDMVLEDTNTDIFKDNKPTLEIYECDNQCQEPFKLPDTDGFQDTDFEFYLKPGKYVVKITSDQKFGTLKLERIIAIPIEYTKALTLPADDREEFLRTCIIESNDLRWGTEDEYICSAGIFSMTMKFQGAFPCACDPVGSYNATCVKFGGKCSCKPGVGGRDCSLCSPGFYNLTSQGCQECQCKGKNKVCNPLDGQCQCPDNTRGRTCDPCFCNGNSGECLRNGTCKNCLSNTMGKECGRCKIGYYGDALKGDCKACNCDVKGAYNSSCDMKTGQCFCKPGVVGMTCSTCAANYYGLSGSGCTACRCNPLGSVTLQCSITGKCLCKSSTKGDYCDSCKQGYFGLPLKSCQECACNETGTFPETFCTADSVGQCLCKKGVVGRSCNVCAKQHFKFTEHGCSQCPLCTRKLQDIADKVDVSLTHLKHDLNLITNLTSLQADLNHAIKSLSGTQLNAVYFEQRLLKGQKYFKYLNENRMKQWNVSVTDIMLQMHDMKARTLKMAPLVEESIQKMQEHYKRAVATHHITSEADRYATGTFHQIVNLNKEASRVNNRTYSYIQNTPSFNFNQYVTQVDNDLATSNKVLANVSDVGKMVDYQERFAHALSAKLTECEGYFLQKRKDWTSGAVVFMQNVQKIYNKGVEVEGMVNETKLVIEKQKSFVQSTKDQQLGVQNLLLQLDGLYKETQGLYERTRMHTQMISGGIEVLFLQYNPQNSMVRVNVLRGYSLVARDYATMTSDPYFRLSIKPSWFQQRAQMSEPKYGTLNPTWDWPIGGTYSFLITGEQMKVTKLNITLYDYDVDSPHDFMGEVIINMADIFPLIKVAATQKTYPLKPQISLSASDKIPFPAVGLNGLLDLQQMLKSQLVVVDKNLIKTNRIYSAARVKANNIHAQTQLLTSTFDQAKRYASKAVKAVNTYNEIYHLINSSLEAAIAANNSVQMISKVLTGISVSSFKSRTSKELLSAQNFLTKIQLRNVTYAVVDIYLRSETGADGESASRPQSVIRVNGYHYKPPNNGHTVVLLDLYSGRVEKIANFRTDLNANAASLSYEQFLKRIPDNKIIVILKQGVAVVSKTYRTVISRHLVKFGALPPYFSEDKEAYIFLGYKREPGELKVPWITQLIKEGGAPCEMEKQIRLKGTLQDLLVMANSTFHASLPQWAEINKLFPDVKTGIRTLRKESFTASVLEASLQGANIMVSQAVSSSQQVLQETENVFSEVNNLTAKYKFLLTAPKNISKIIQKGHSLVIQAESKLSNQKTNLNKADDIEKQFTARTARIDSSHLRMEEELKKLQKLAAQMPFTITFHTHAQSTYKLHTDTASAGDGRAKRSTHGGVGQRDKLFSVVQFDVRTNATDGILFYLLAKPPTMGGGGIGMYLVDGFLYVAYNMGQGDIVGRIGTLVKIGRWYTIHLARSAKDAQAILQDDTGYKTKIKLTSPLKRDLDHLTFSSKTRWYLNGFPPGMMKKEQKKYGSLSATYDNLYIDGQRYNLWDEVDFNGERSYAPYRYPLPGKTNGSWVTLFGNGFIKHDLGSFSTSNQFSAVELEFRTLSDNVVVFGVTGSEGIFVYSLLVASGKLMFQFATSLGNNIALITTRNAYNNGEWYRVKVWRSGVNASMVVNPLNMLSQHLAEEKTVFIGITQLPKGYDIVFGSDAVAAGNFPVRNLFAGDLRNLYLSVKDEMEYRSFTSPKHLVGQNGTSYYERIPGKVVAGARFYGYMWWEKKGSYSVLLRFKTIEIKSVYFSFKTEQLSGLLLFKPAHDAKEYDFYMCLMAGNLVVIQRKSGAESRRYYISEDLQLSDGQWHNISVAYTYSGFQLRVDNKLIYTGWFGGHKKVAIGKGLVYVGGLPKGYFTASLPTTRSITIDFESLMVNRIEQNLLTHGVGVSHAGITPGLDMAQPAPSCAAEFPDLLFAPDPVQVRFGKTPWAGFQSYLGYRLPDKVLKGYFASSFVVTMSFRASIGDGIIFYIADNETTPTQYVSLEMVDGKLRYEFNNGVNLVSIETGNVTKYYGQGQWYKVYMLRIYQFGAILVPETMEYKNNRHNDESIKLQLKTPLYIGGLPPNVNAPHFVTRKHGYNGCIRKFEISAGYETHGVDFTKPDLGGTKTGTTSCYSNTEPGVYFNGKNSWVYYSNNFILLADFTIELRFRTYRRTGTLLYLYSKQTPKGVAPGGRYGSYMLLELNDGKLQFHYKASLIQHGKVFEWKDIRSDPSYYLCNQRWHVVKVMKRGLTVSINVDNILAFGGGKVEPVNSGLINGNMWIGGVKGNIQKPGVKTKSFDGCLEILSLGHTKNKIHNSIDGNNVIFGCPTF